jgi:hypothetical protein
LTNSLIRPIIVTIVIKRDFDIRPDCPPPGATQLPHCPPREADPQMVACAWEAQP